MIFLALSRPSFKNRDRIIIIVFVLFIINCGNERGITHWTVIIELTLRSDQFANVMNVNVRKTILRIFQSEYFAGKFIFMPL